MGCFWSMSGSSSAGGLAPERRPSAEPTEVSAFLPRPTPPDDGAGGVGRGEYTRLPEADADGAASPLEPTIAYEGPDGRTAVVCI